MVATTVGGVDVPATVVLGRVVVLRAVLVVVESDPLGMVLLVVVLLVVLLVAVLLVVVDIVVVVVIVVSGGSGALGDAAVAGLVAGASGRVICGTASPPEAQAVRTIAADSATATAPGLTSPCCPTRSQQPASRRASVQPVARPLQAQDRTMPS